ncbi:MAG: sigma 54-interacting transcriptional regulator [Patescibacteria group bacterium]
MVLSRRTSIDGLDPELATLARQSEPISTLFETGGNSSELTNRVRQVVLLLSHVLQHNLNGQLDLFTDSQRAEIMTQVAAQLIEVGDRIKTVLTRAGIDALLPHQMPPEIVDSQSIIGLKKEKDMVDSIAPTDFSVLLQGARGTGKELLARRVHEKSRRRKGPLIVVDCAAIPDSLIESELFGHERGAFTGAVHATPGRFRMADKGTLFLDEVGELPPSVQPTLLRVLQERSFYSVGGSEKVSADVRIVGATNRNLAVEAGGGRFRLDLFDRINQFPIVIRPLCERMDELPLLIDHIIKKYSAQFSGKNITGVNPQAATILSKQSWPGNVRQLENVIIRAMVKCPGGLITPDDIVLDENEGSIAAIYDLQSSSDLQNSSYRIVSEVLRLCHDVLTGKNTDPDIMAKKMKKIGSLDVIEGAFRRLLVETSLSVAGGFRNKVCDILGVGNARLFGWLSNELADTAKRFPSPRHKGLPAK